MRLWPSVPFLRQHNQASQGDESKAYSSFGRLRSRRPYNCFPARKDGRNPLSQNRFSAAIPKEKAHALANDHASIGQECALRLPVTPLDWFGISASGQKLPVLGSQ